MNECVELVRLRLKPGTAKKLMELRPAMVQGLMDANPAIRRLMLLQVDDENWLDVVWWSSREEAEQALGSQDARQIPALQAWSAEAGAPVSVDVTDVIADSILG